MNRFLLRKLTVFINLQIYVICIIKASSDTFSRRQQGGEARKMILARLKSVIKENKLQIGSRILSHLPPVQNTNTQCNQMHKYIDTMKMRLGSFFLSHSCGSTNTNCKRDALIQTERNYEQEAILCHTIPPVQAQIRSAIRCMNTNTTYMSTT